MPTADTSRPNLGESTSHQGWGSDFRELGKETWAICASAFLAEIVLGAMASTFSLHAHAFGLDPVAIGTLAAFEGLAYAGFMVAGQTYLAVRTTQANRGTVGGIYAMASGLAGTVSPFVLGLVAERWNLRTVFAASGAIVGCGFLLYALGLSATWSRLRDPRGAAVDRGA